MENQKPETYKAARKTRETDVVAAICLDGKGEAKVRTGIGFLDHMLTLFAVHGLFDLTVEATGDTFVDDHHTVEDVGLILGEAIAKAVAARTNISRYGFFALPMDEALCLCALDLSNRPYLVFNVPFSSVKVGTFDTQLFLEFFRAVAVKAGMTLHVNVPYGENDHHKIEAVFKAFGRALAAAVRTDPRAPGVFSSKGVL